MELLFELLIQIVGEFLIHVLFEFGFSGLVEPFRTDRPANAYLALFSYVLLGLVGGVISVWLVPEHLIQSKMIQYANLVLTRIALGLAFEWMGRYRQSHGRPRMVLGRFSYGFFCALTMGAIRFAFAACDRPYGIRRATRVM